MVWPARLGDLPTAKPRIDQSTTAGGEPLRTLSTHPPHRKHHAYFIFAHLLLTFCVCWLPNPFYHRARRRKRKEFVLCANPSPLGIRIEICFFLDKSSLPTEKSNFILAVRRTVYEQLRGKTKADKTTTARVGTAGAYGQTLPARHSLGATLQVT